jgi:NADP-dependent 3-hydroxy acid dehydrogenase YdfG
MMSIMIVPPRRLRNLRLSGLVASPLAFDVTDQPAVRAAFETGLNEIGPVDILINNA